MSKKLTYDEQMAKVKELGIEETVRRMITNLRDTSKSQGIHVVYSGLNTLLKQAFGVNPKDAIDELVETKKFGSRPVKGGAMVYLPEDAEAMVTRANQAIAQKTIDAIIS